MHIQEQNKSIFKNRYLIVGASSGIALPLIKLILKNEPNPELFLMARNIEKVKKYLGDLVENTSIHLIKYDMLTDSISLNTEWGINYALLFPGIIPQTPEEYAASITVNFSGVVTATETIVQYYASTLKNILITTSTAGTRVRKNNYIYGSAKAGLIGYCSGLRHKLYPGIHVTTLVPGPLQTRMTEAIKIPSFLLNTPEAYAQKIYRGIFSRKHFIYSSFQWRLISFILRNMPEFILLRTGYQLKKKNENSGN